MREEREHREMTQIRIWKWYFFKGMAATCHFFWFIRLLVVLQTIQDRTGIKDIFCKVTRIYFKITLHSNIVRYTSVPMEIVYIHS